MQQRSGSGSYGEKNVKNLTKPLDASAPKAQMSIISNYATSPLGLDKATTASIITSDFGLRTSA